MLRATLKRIFLVVVILVWSNSELFSQLDTIHYLPPSYTNNTHPNHNGEQYVVLSTNENTPFFVTMYNNAGRFQRVKISRSQPQIIDLGYQSAAWGVIDNADLNKALDDEGMVLEADQPFFVNARHRSGTQGVMITTKGKVAAGYDFYAGHMYTVYPTNGSLRNNFVSVMATEDNTVVTFNNPDAKYYNQPNNTFSVTLNKYQSYVVADLLNQHTWSGDPLSTTNIAKANAINGTHVTSTKPIVVNSGTWLGSGTSTLQDMGIDQIVPKEYVGNSYIITRGRGSSYNEKVILIATANNTVVKINDVNVTTIANAGDYYIVNDSYYTSKNNMYIESTHPVYVYQTLAGNVSDATSGMAFIPPLNCLSNQKVTIPFATQLINSVNMTDPNGNSPALTLITKPETNITINGIDKSVFIGSYPNNHGPDAVPGTDWVSYYITDFNFTGFTATGDWHFEIDADRAINAELSIRDGAVGAGCFFSGFGEDPILSKEAVLEGGTACLPDNAIFRANGFSTYEWQKNGFDIVGATSESYVPTDLGYYRVRGVTQCDGLEVKSKYSKEVEVRPCLSINDVTIVEPNSPQVVTFQVKLGIPQSQDVSFTYQTQSETATPSWDYNNKIGTITIPAGDSVASITVTVLPDFLDEDDEVFYVVLSNPVNCDFSIPIGKCTIIDNDPSPTYTFASPNIIVTEGVNAFATFTINLSAVSGRRTWVRYTTMNISAISGEDYVEKSDTLFFNAGITTGQIQIPIIDDELFEPNIEQFKIRILEAGNLTFNNLQTEKLASIIDNDSPVYFSVADTQIVEGGALNFWISIDKPYAIDLDIDYETQDNSATIADNDYTPVSGTATIPAGQTMVMIPVQTTDDTKTESDEVINFNLSNLPGWHGLFAKPQAYGFIINDDCTPLAVDDAFTVQEEATLSGVSVKDNDQDLCDEPLAFAVVTPPVHAESFTFDAATGALTYKGKINFFGIDNFTYSVTDDDGEVSIATVTITVINVNDIPVANDTTITIDEDITTTFRPIENDEDPDLSGLTIVSVGSVSNASVTIAANGKDLIFDPNQDYNGTVTFTYTINDGEGDAASATITVIINPVNDSPTAIDDYITTDEDVLSLAFNPLTNDYDADGSGLSLVSIGSPTHGALIAQGDGTYKYQPNANYNGTDQVTYVIKDGENDQATGTIFITVNPVNDPPVAVPENTIVIEDTPKTYNIFANDYDVDGNLLPSGITIVQQPANGTIVLNGDGTVTYTPNPDYFGTDSYRYQLTDQAGATSNIVTNNILVSPVNDFPIAVDDYVTITEDPLSPLVILPLANDKDPDKTGLILSVLVHAKNGISTLVGNNIIYMPNPNFNGNDTIFYQIKEVAAGANTDDGMIVITVTPVNDIPTAVDDNVTVLEDNTIDIDVLANDLDPDFGGLTIVTVGTPLHGTASVVSGVVRYIPNANYFGPDSFTYTIADVDGDQSTATVTITVTADDTDNPVAVNDFITTNEDVSVGINPALNDADPDLSGLIVSVVGGPSNGAITSQVGNVLTYMPNPNFNGKDTIEYRVTEVGAGGGSAQAFIIITVTPVNDIPTAVDDNVTVLEDNTIDIDVLANDLDPDFGGLTIVSLGLPVHGTATIVSGKVRYTPNADYFGTDAFSYTISDIDGDESTANIAITITADDSDAPVANDDIVITDEDTPVTIQPVNNDYDPDLSGLTLTVLTAPQNGSFVQSGNDLSYTPDADYFGLDSIRYQITEVGAGNQFATAWIRIIVNPVNDLPTANDDVETVVEDNSLTINPLVNDLDPDKGGLTILRIYGPQHGTATIALDGLSIDYVPAADYFGADSIEYVITDVDGDTDSAMIRITITADDSDAPVANDDLVITDEDTPVTIQPVNNDYDPDLSGLTLTVLTAPQNGSFVQSGNDLSYTPDADYFGLDSIRYQITEVGAGNQFATAWIRIIVNPVNDLPTANDDVETVVEDNSLTINPLVNDLDPDKGGLTILRIYGPQHGTATIALDGLSIDYVPAADYFGADSIEYVITDVDGDTDSAMIRITVTADDSDAPVANDDIVITDEDTPVTIQPVNNDYDPDLSGLTLTVLTAPQNGSFVQSGNDLSYTPDADYFGLDSIRYQITEVGAGNQFATAWIRIIVNPVNDLPTANDDVETVVEDNSLTINPLVNDLDPDKGGLTILRIYGPQHGTATIALDGLSIDYVPAADYFGVDSIEYVITDVDGDTDSAMIRITVTADDSDAPVANDDIVITDEDTPVTIQPVNNDYDPDLSGLTLTVLTAPQNGSFVQSGNDLSYTPDADYFGLDSIRYQITEVGAGNQFATAWIRIIVNPVNDLPTANDDVETVVEDNSLTINPLVNDLDPDNGGLTILRIYGPQHGTATIALDGLSIDYVPAADYFGADSIEYVITDVDGDTDSAMIRITITADDSDAPVANDDIVITDEDTPVTIQPVNNDYDPDLSGLTLTVLTAPQNGSFVQSGNDLSYTPDADYFGLDSIRYQITEVGAGNQFATAWIRIIVNPVNDLPTANDDVETVVEDNSLTINPLVNDLDPDNGGLTILRIYGPQHGTATIALDGLSIDYVPAADYFGADSIEYVITDVDGDTDSAMIRITITADDSDAPVANDDLVITDEDTPVTIQPVNNDYDPDLSGLTLTVLTAPQNGSFVQSGNDLSYTPDADYFGLDSIRYQITEVGAGNQFATAWIRIIVNPVNDLPTANDDVETVVEDNSLTINPLVNDLDPDKGGLTILRIYGPQHGTATIALDGLSIDYVPAADYFGADSIEYVITDVDGDTDSAMIRITITADDSDAPVANDDTVITDEDTPVTIQPVNNDYDPDLSGLTLTVLTAPQNGSFVQSGNDLSYTPDADYFGLDSIRYQITEVGAGNQFATAWIRIIVNPVSDMPIALNDTIVLNEDDSLDVQVLVNDLDPDKGGIKIHHVGTSVNSTLVISSDSLYVTYIPNKDFFGVDSVYYYISDVDGDIDSALVFATVIADDNDAPVANDDIVVIKEDQTVDIYPLANDYDPDLSGLIMTIVTEPKNGTYIRDGDTIRYTPAFKFNGADTIQYMVKEVAAGQDSAFAYIILRVDTVNDRPIAVDDYVIITEDVADTIWVLANDIDLDWGYIIVDSVSLSGVASVSLTADSTGIVYVPSLDFYGLDTLQYIIRDAEGDKDTAWVFITVLPVNDVPIALNDTLVTDEDISGSVNILMNDYDADRQGVVISVSVQPLLGIVTIDTTGLLTYIPHLNLFGSDSLQYVITDKEGDADSAWVIITINPVNDKPIANNDYAILLEDTRIDIPVLVNDFDVEGPIPFDSVFVVYTTVNGSAELIPGTGVIRYTPVPNFFGLDSLGYYIKDAEGLASDTAYVYLTVRNVNDFPIALNDTVVIDEDSTVYIAILANDVDVDRSGLTIVILDGPELGSITIINDTLRYEPIANIFGNDTIHYAIVDGEGDTAKAFVFITIISVNDIPVVNDDYVVILEETPVDIPVLVNDYDVEGPIPVDSVFIVRMPAFGTALLIPGTGVVNYLPELNYFGNDTLTYYVKDSDGAASDTAYVIITVINVNENPVAVNDTIVMPEDSVFTIVPMANDIDADKSTIRIDSIDAPHNGSLIANATMDTFIYIPFANYFGRDSVQYTIIDGEGDSARAWIHIFVTSVNDLPVAVNDTIVISSIQPYTINILANDFDIETPVSQLVVDIIVNPLWGSAIIEVGTGLLVYTPDWDFYYSDSLYYTITDADGAVDTALVFIYDRDSILDTDDDGLVNLIDGDDDYDLDGIPNYLDLDSDGDGIPDAIEGLLDRNGNGQPDYIDPFDWDGDDDGDGLINRYEDTNNDGNPYNDDCNGNGIPNYLDANDQCEDYLNIPNAFSPNGDGINDLFYINGLWNFPDAHITIFNRWGSRVYEKKHYGDERRYGPYEAWWNGQTSRIGKADVPEGVYFYRLTIGRNRNVKEGFIHIRR
jgi:large repetitive protein